MHFQSAAVFSDRVARIVERETARISSLLPGARIEHVGGTSIPGALTKGDVDIAVATTAEDFPRAVETLGRLYGVNQRENWSRTFASFKNDASWELPLGVQVVVRGSSDDFFQWFRQRLIADPEALAAYNSVKRRHEGADPLRYREAKTRFIEGLLAGRNRGTKRAGESKSP